MKETRRHWLNALLNGPRYMGDRGAFCKDAGITNGRLSQLLDPREAFGDVAANKLVEKLNLQPDYFSRIKPLEKLPEAPPPAAEHSAPAAQPGAAPNYLSLDRLFNLLPNDPLIRAVVFQRASAVILDVINGMTGTTPEPVHTEMSQKSDA